MPLTNYGRGRGRELKVHAVIEKIVFSFPLCGAVAHRAYQTTDKARVTCGRCKQLLHKLPDKKVTDDPQSVH